MKKRFGNILLVFLILTLTLSLIKNIVNFQKKLGSYRQYQAENDKLIEENKNLKSQIGKLKDPNYTEKEIRDNLNLLKPNEIAVIIPQITIMPTPTPTITKPPYQQWLELFLK